MDADVSRCKWLIICVYPFAHRNELLYIFHPSTDGWKMDRWALRTNQNSLLNVSDLLVIKWCKVTMLVTKGWIFMKGKASMHVRHSINAHGQKENVSNCWHGPPNTKQNCQTVGVLYRMIGTCLAFYNSNTKKLFWIWIYDHVYLISKGKITTSVDVKGYTINFMPGL